MMHCDPCNLGEHFYRELFRVDVISNRLDPNSPGQVSQKEHSKKIMKTIMKRITNIVSAVCCLISGLLWALSAQTQMTASDAIGSNAAEIAAQLNYISQYHNMFSAWGSAAAGIALFCGLLFE